MQLWHDILSRIEKKVSHQNFDIWFKPTWLEEQNLDEKKLFVRVPNKHFKRWLATNYSEIIRSSLNELNLDHFQVAFVVDERHGNGTSEKQLSESGQSSQAPVLCNLNGKYTFGRFVIGCCNQFAHAAAVAVAERPGKAYNPLFIYGGVGLGKTHLMHAMGHTIKAHTPNIRLSYMSSECFMNELINAIRYDKTIHFREKYRNTDVLLMDDIQFLAGKERTQEEFFHTFNALYDSQKQIVISSDSPPKEIPTLEERLHSRFEWGLIADIQPPDVETKVAILRNKAEFESVEVSDDVAFFIANNVRSNVRELEGSLVRLAAYSSLTGEQITLDLARRVLISLIEKSSRLISIDAVQKAVADHYDLKVSDLKAKDNSRRVAEPRQVAMFLCRELTGSSLPQIAKEFGGKHHTTVMHSIRKIASLRRDNPRLEGALSRLSEALQ